ncbi:PASTA domain-containing protein [Treponema parvum]|uniref:PASTA domain-containing protein n=1 Tax=Treponema parvum TaxID=138851 RepID=A0A975F269_9SPIR|nr:PASTA domain-containing protein [Treponema parvum]QTQ13023.1 PASTA domain-containing protein [Treponema parvum]
MDDENKTSDSDGSKKNSLFGKNKFKITKINAADILFKLKNFFFNKLRINAADTLSLFQKNSKAMIFTFVSAFILMIFTAGIVFFAVVQGQEKVMVPDVTGQTLADALIEMQEKELYPKIRLRYSERPGDAGKILEQNPGAGMIVKAGRRISLVVSKGVVIDHIEDYKGLILDDVRIQLQTLFAGSANPLIVLADPVYKADVSSPGVILEQNPAPGTVITEPVTLNLIVSRGPEFENTRVPNIIGKNVKEMLDLIQTSKIVFDFTSHTAQANEIPGTIVQQQTFDKEFIPNYSRVSAEFAFPAANSDEFVFGILSETLTNYPYPVPVRIEVQSPEAEPYTLISFSHPGGNFTVPYELAKGSVLVLYVVEKERSRTTVK